MFSHFPKGNSLLVHGEQFCEFHLAQPMDMAVPFHGLDYVAFNHPVVLKGGIPEEGNDRRQMGEARTGPAHLPVVDGFFRDPQGGCHIPLRQTQIQAPLPNVVPKGSQLFGVVRVLRLFGR
jgi:hypothetical protein